MRTVGDLVKLAKGKAEAEAKIRGIEDPYYIYGKASENLKVD